MRIFDEWINDIPSQFREKKNIDVLIKAFSKQLQEVQQMFVDLYRKTDLDVATGQNLDYVGTIIPLTRKEAGELAGIGATAPVISDEKYRQYLRYKMLRNTSDCTYHDIMNAIEILWDVDKASYYERLDRPATIFIGLPDVDIEDDDQAKGKPTILRPAGVGFLYTARYSMIIDQSRLEKVKFVHIDVHAFFYFFKRILNGSWPLDGSVSFNQVPICEIDMGIAIGTICVAHERKVSFTTLDIPMAVIEVLPSDCCSMENGYRFDLSGLLDAGEENIGVTIPVHMEAGVEVDSVTVEKDLWHLDGQVLMDGSRILDAEVWKEEL